MRLSVRRLRDVWFPFAYFLLNRGPSSRISWDLVSRRLQLQAPSRVYHIIPCHGANCLLSAIFDDGLVFRWKGVTLNFIIFNTFVSRNIDLTFEPASNGLLSRLEFLMTICRSRLQLHWHSWILPYRPQCSMGSLSCRPIPSAWMECALGSS